MSELTDTQREWLSSEIQKYILPSLIFEVLVFGIFVTVATISIYLLISKRSKTRSNWILLGGIVSSAIVAIVQFISDIHWTTKTVGVLLSPGVHWNYREASMVWLVVSGLFSSEFYFGPVFIISDMLLVWRSACFFPRASLAARMTIILLTLILLARTIVVPLAIMGIGIDIAIFSMIMSPISILINTVCSGAMIHKAVQYKRLTESTKTHHFKALLLLAESGVFYLVVQLIGVALIFAGRHGERSAFTSIVYLFAAFYPAVLVILIERQLSLADTSQDSRATVAPEARRLVIMNPGSSTRATGLRDETGNENTMASLCTLR
jgi:hypothetical protein